MLGALLSMSKPTVENLLDYGASNRKLRAYAYLTAAFETKPRYGDGVADVLDCLVPFVVAGTSQQVGNHLNLPELSKFLATLGLNIPLYVLEQLLPRLQKIGAIEWNSTYRVHICRAPPESIAPLPNTAELAPIFDNIESRLASFAQAHGVHSSVSETWADALISFLRSETAREVRRPIQVKGAIIGDRDRLDGYIVAGFIQAAHDADADLFQQILQIFTGILIEDFLNTIQTLGAASSYKGLSVFYDTTILLRLLGTSGKVLATATLEMHRALQDLGCQTHYFDHNESEVVQILSTLIEVHGAGKELFGETAEALVNGEVSIATLRDLTATYADRLAALSIFRSQFSYSTTRYADEHQVDERRFESALESAAIEYEKSYRKQAAQHDAMSLALILRLRRGKQAKDVSQCACIFVSRNHLLQRTARRFLVDHAGYDWTTVPAILSIGQISTVAWLAASKTLEPVQVTKELLGNCYSAMRPDSSWAASFLDALERFKRENPEQVDKYADSAIFLQTARFVAQNESLGQTAILQRLNTVEIFKKAAEVAEQKDRERAIETDRAVEEAINRGRIEGVQSQKDGIRLRSDYLARIAVNVVRVILVLSLLAAAFFLNMDDNKLGIWALIVFAILNVLSFMDLTGIKVLSRPLEKFRDFLSRRIFELLSGE
jgi:hypothetical protein